MARRIHLRLGAEWGFIVIEIIILLDNYDVIQAFDNS